MRFFLKTPIKTGFFRVGTEFFICVYLWLFPFIFFPTFDDAFRRLPQEDQNFIDVYQPKFSAQSDSNTAKCILVPSTAETALITRETSRDATFRSALIKTLSLPSSRRPWSTARRIISFC